MVHFKCETRIAISLPSLIYCRSPACELPICYLCECKQAFRTLKPTVYIRAHVASTLRDFRPPQQPQCQLNHPSSA